MDKNKRDAAADLAMCQAATPGPWKVTRQNGDFSGIAEGVVVGAGPSDTEFITQARTALPHWIERAQAAERELPAARALLIDMRERFERSEAEVERLKAENARVVALAGAGNEKLIEALRTVEQLLEPMRTHVADALKKFGQP